MRPQTLIAYEVAALAHAGQYRRDRITPYISHPAGVVSRLTLRGGADDTTCAAAWLHDVLEDTAMTYQQMREHGISDDVLEVVVCLTRGEDDAYDQYLARVKADPRARAIKIADMLHNLSDSPTEKQILKYAKGLQLLLG